MDAAPDLTQVDMPQQAAPDLSSPELSMAPAPDLSQMSVAPAPDLTNPDYSNEGRQPPVSEGIGSQVMRGIGNVWDATGDVAQGAANLGTSIGANPQGALVGAANMVPALAALPGQALNTVGSFMPSPAYQNFSQLQKDTAARNQAIGQFWQDAWDKLGTPDEAKLATSDSATAVSKALALPWSEPNKVLVTAMKALKAEDPQMSADLIETAIMGALPALEALKPGSKVAPLRQDIINEVNKAIPKDVVPDTGAGIPPQETPPPMKSEAVQAAENLAPVDPGMVRVYRGMNGSTAPEGVLEAWFTTDPDLASGYGKDVRYVDIPEDIYKEQAAQTGQTGIRLPKDWVNESKPLSAGEALPTYEVKEEAPSVRSPIEQQTLQQTDYQALARATKQGGMIDPSTTLDGWVGDLVDRLKSMGAKPHQISDAVYDKYKGSFDPAAIDNLKLLGTGDSAKEGSTRPTLMTQQQYLRFTSEQQAGFSSEASAKYNNISNALASTTGLSDIPKLVVDKVDGKWQVVDHDGRHRAEMLQKNGQYGMPVRIEDRTHGDFNRENPKTVISQRGEELATPKSMYPEQPIVARNPFAGPGGKQGGAIDLSAFTPKEQADYERAIPILGRNRQTFEEFAASHPVEGPDINRRIGAGDGSFRTHSELNKHADELNHGIHVGAFVDDQMHLKKEDYERKIIEKVLPNWNQFRSRYQTRLLPQEAYAGFLPFYKTFVKDTKIALDLEKNPTWFDGTSYSPTVEQLKAAGMDPKSAVSWNNLYKGWDNVWPDMEDFAKQRGMDIPPRVPGYLPHFTQGAWVVRLFRETPDGGREYAASVGAKSAAQANEFKTTLDNHAEKNPNGYTTVIEPPNINNDLASMIHGIFEVKTKIGQDQALSALLGRLYEQSSMGFLQGALERAKNPQYLHQLDRIGSGDTFQLTPKETFNAMGKMKTLMEAIPAMKMRGDFCRDILFPLESGGFFDNRPNLLNAVQEYVKQFMHIPDTSAGHIDSWVKDNFVRMGKDPGIPGKWIQSLNNATAMWYLLYSPRFLFNGQLTQKFLGSSIVWQAKADARNTGLPGADKMSVSKALLQDLAYSSKKIMLGSGESLHDYAMKTGHAQPTFIENLDTSHVFNDPLAKWIEQYTRQGGMRLGYLLYRQVMTEKDALNAAGRFTDNMNVQYSSDLGKPFVFSKEGEYFKPTFTFMQYWMHQFQQLSSHGTTIANSWHAGDPGAIAESSMGLASSLAAMVAVGGLQGLPFVMTANAIVNYFNENFGTEWPTAKEVARSTGDLLRNTDWGSPYANLVAKVGEFGLTSTATGYDMSSSGQGPNPQIPGEVFLSFLGTLGTAAIMAGKWAFKPGGVTIKDMSEDIGKLPPALRGDAEYLLRNKSLEDVWKFASGQVQDQAPSKLNVEWPGNYTRTPLDSILTLVGLKSIGEAAQNTTSSIDAMRQKAQDVVTATMSQQVMSNPGGPKTAEYLVYLAQRFHEDPQTILGAIQQYQKSRYMTEDQRRFTQMDADNPASTSKMLRWLEEQRLTPK